VGIPGLAPDAAEGLPLFAIRPAQLEDFLRNNLTRAQAAFIGAQGFAAVAGSLALVPGPDGLAGALLGLGEQRTPFAFGGLATKLPAGSVWRITPGDFDPDDAALGFLLGAYTADPRKSLPNKIAAIEGADVSSRTREIVKAVNFARGLINTPPNLLGPAELAGAAVDLAGAFGAASERVNTAALSTRYPIIDAVGAGSDRGPEVVILSWAGSTAGADAPLISLCGKGVCFDTGGYDLKPSAAMLKMKKDMGGAAILLGVARCVMALDLPVRLKLRIGCVENSISGRAMRPSDVLRTVSGVTIEVGNTDAEGRLVLCDLLAEAAAEKPLWLIDAATLTGAARSALGPDLPALFSNNAKLGNVILDAGVAVDDPLWQLPLHIGYNSWLDSPNADMNTVSSKPFAGAIVAALFLQRFIPTGQAWAHIDTYAWNDQNRPGRPEGGEAQTLRALLAAIETLI